MMTAHEFWRAQAKAAATLYHPEYTAAQVDAEVKLLLDQKSGKLRTLAYSESKKDVKPIIY